MYRVITLIGLAIALVTGPLAFPPVQNAIFPRQTRITVQVLREAAAFDINRQFSGLSVIYRGRDLVSTHHVLAFIKVRVKNTGSISVFEDNISKTDPVGIAVSGGQLLGTVDVTASSDHLRRRALPTVSGDAAILPSNIILDPSDYVEFSLVVLKPSATKLTYSTLGKVVGVKSIELNMFGEGQDQSIWSNAFGGGISVQLLRSFGYLIFLIVLFVFVVGVAFQFEQVSKAARIRRRKKVCSQVRLLMQDVDQDSWALISNIYANRGAFGLRALRAILDGEVRASPVGQDTEVLERLPDESAAAYLARAMAIIPPWDDANYITKSALKADIDLLDQQRADAIMVCMKRFESVLEEVVVEHGWSRKGLDSRPEFVDVEVINEFAARHTKSEAKSTIGVSPGGQ